MVDDPRNATSRGTADERWHALEELDGWLRTPMLMLSFLWLMLVVAELIWGTSSALEIFGTAIWIAFLAEFAVRLALAPEKAAFLKRNWLTVIALIIPAFRLLRAFRFLRFARAARGPRPPAGAHRGNSEPRHERPALEPESPGPRLCFRPNRCDRPPGRGRHAHL